MNSVVVYQFWNPTCRPCAVLKPMFAMMADDFADRVTWVSVNTHEDTHDYKGKYDVTVVPTLVAVIKDANGKDLSVTKHSGTTVPPYFHLVRFAVINSKKDAVERAA